MSSVVTGAQAWPAVVWDASLLRGLDARARAEIEAAGRLHSLRAGDVLFRVGDPADALYVVASGGCTLSGVRRGEADAVVIRRVKKGDALGEEAIVTTFSTRQLEARCEAPSMIAEVPLVVLRRAIGRTGGAEMMAKVERSLRRATTLDLLRTTSFTRGLPDSDLELLLDAAKHEHVARGDHVYREGDPATNAYLVADGLLQAQTDDEGTPRVEAYLGRGDVFGDEELSDREPRSVAVVASGPTWLVAIPRDVFVVVARRNAGELNAARRLRSEGAAAEKRRLPLAGAQTTAHVFRDLYRMRVARSLLVIDQDSCIRCGHCAWSCADVHDDGVSRLVRRGDKMVVSDGSDERTPLLVPNSCQHCKNPSCMIDCPTGAIGRDARGEVFIREDLCTGCGNCAKGCPWENISMAPRAKKDKTPYPLVAVKCDLCKGVDGGPACVASCPTQAIARIDPNAALAELRALAPGMGGVGLGAGAGGTRAAGAGGARAGALTLASAATAASATIPGFAVRIPAWPWAIGAAFAGTGLLGVNLGRWTSGILTGALIFLLVGYAVAKRVRGPRALATLRGRVPVARWLYIAHLSLGAFACGSIAAHVGAHSPPNAAGALTIAVALAVLTGVFGALIGGFVPRALSKIERKSVLPEELPARPRELDEKIFSALSGKTELVKTLFLKSLRPYHRRLLGPLFLILSRRSLREEQSAIRARLDHLTGGKKGLALIGIDDLIRLVVEHRAVRAQRVLTWTLRGWLIPHLGATAAAIILLVLHVVAVSRAPTTPSTSSPSPSASASASPSPSPSSSSPTKGPRR